MPPPIWRKLKQGYASTQKGKNARNAHTQNNRLRLSQHYTEVVGVGANNNRLRLSQHYAEVVGVGANNNRLRLSKHYVEVIVAVGNPSSSYGFVL